MATEQEYKAEIDRLRLLLERMSIQRKSRIKGYTIELEPSPMGFLIVVTGISAADEIDALKSLAALINGLLRGAIRFSLASWSEWPKAKEKSDADGDELQGTLMAMSRTAMTSVQPGETTDDDTEQVAEVAVSEAPVNADG